MSGNALRRTRTRLMALAEIHSDNPIATFVREIADAIVPELGNEREDVVDIPKSADQAELMVKMGLSWLESNAPGRLAFEPTHFAFLSRRPQDKQHWPLIYGTREAAEECPSRTSSIVAVRLDPWPCEHDLQKENTTVLVSGRHEARCTVCRRQWDLKRA